MIKFFSQAAKALGTVQILVFDEPERVDQRYTRQVAEMYKKKKEEEYFPGMTQNAT